MSPSDYPVITIEPEWVLQPEALGSKEKFWFRGKDYETDWLFKFPEDNTGQHWAEKIAAEIAAALEISHAQVEFALFQGRLGSAAKSFASGGWELFHGNQILAGKVLGYEPTKKKFQHSNHTLANILAAIDSVFIEPDIARVTKTEFAGYLVLDGLIGNTDRHHENWGILRAREGGGWIGTLAPSFDHASSLGRELLDTSKGMSRERLLRDGLVGRYAERARGGIYWQITDKHGLSPLELVVRAAQIHQELFRPALTELNYLDRDRVQEIIDRIPSTVMTSLQREFAVELMCYNSSKLREIRV